MDSLDFVIKARKSKCDKGAYFYDLYCNDIWICGLNSLELIMKRIKFIYKTRRFDLKGYYDVI
jgi:hypothetical protein